MGNMRFKVGDRVRIKSLDWYNENKDENGNIDVSHDFTFYADRSKHCGKVFTIVEVLDNCYTVKEDNHEYYWSDEMIEGLVEEEVGLIDKLSSRWVNEFNLPDGYIFKDENGNVINATKIVLEKKKKEYPKTYEECCKILGLLNIDLCFNADYRSFDASKEQWKKLGLMNQFYQLLICRDAYWKIAGEEMGLGKPWEPDWSTENDIKYVIEVYRNNVRKNSQGYSNTILAFPTKEMRDAFYENFKSEIEICKELL